MNMRVVRTVKEQGLRTVFFPDAGPEAGLGHIRRCLVLASELRKRGAACRFVIEPEPGGGPILPPPTCRMIRTA